MILLLTVPDFICIFIFAFVEIKFKKILNHWWINFILWFKLKSEVWDVHITKFGGKRVIFPSMFFYILSPWKLVGCKIWDWNICRYVVLPNYYFIKFWPDKYEHFLKGLHYFQTTWKKNGSFYVFECCVNDVTYSVRE